jgi:uncharacterized glyoxalase superfamily protein PhnB
VASGSPDPQDWISERVPNLREQRERSGPKPSHDTVVTADDVDAHHQDAKAAGTTILMSPTNQIRGLLSYAAIDPDGHQQEFSRRDLDRFARVPRTG